MSKNKYLLYIDTALVIDEQYSQFVKNSERKEQILHGLKKLMEYDFASKGCDILFTDNTIAEIDPDIQNILPKETIYRIFDDNRYGRWNKGAGLIQKWLHNKNILNNYEYIIFFEARLELLSHYFFDKFFQSPKTYFRNGQENIFTDEDPIAFTGLFSCPPSLFWKLTNAISIDTLIINSISIEIPMRTLFLQEENHERLANIYLRRFCFTGIIEIY